MGYKVKELTEEQVQSCGGQGFLRLPWQSVRLTIPGAHWASLGGPGLISRARPNTAADCPLAITHSYCSFPV